MNKFLEMFKDKKVMHITDSDTDGVMCCILGEMFIEPLCSVFLPYMNNDRSFTDIELQNVDMSDVILFTDIAPDLNLLDYIRRHSSEKIIVICDHHDTSYEILKNENIKHYYYTSDFCGTKIFFDKLSEGTRPKKIIKDVVDLVDTYDC